MSTNKLFHILCSVMLGIIACAIPSCRQKTEFDFRISRTTQELRRDLLEQIPIGSTVEEVYDFFKRNNIPSAANQRHGYSRFFEEDNIVGLKMKADIWGGEWLIDFKFDEARYLQDIEVEFFRTLP